MFQILVLVALGVLVVFCAVIAVVAYGTLQKCA
jgi:hypothetical protein